MDNNAFVDYLNSLHNYNAQNENAYGERNVGNAFFKDVMVKVGLCDFIKCGLTEKEPHIVILTGHAGDGKTSIMYQVLTELELPFQPDEKESLVRLPAGNQCLCIKDFSELSDYERKSTMESLVKMPERDGFVFMVANTGPLINTFGELFDSDQDRENARIELINSMDSNTGEIVKINGIKICVINVATVDNTYFATELLKKLLQDKLWSDCDGCSKRRYCHIYRNKNLIVHNKAKVLEFVNNHFVWLREHGKRLTIRSMTEQLAYMLTGGISCEEVLVNESYKYLFSNLFFGYIGTKVNDKALNIVAVRSANECNYDHRRLRSDENLLVDREYKQLFGEEVANIITEAEGKNTVYIKGWTEFLRRTYFFMNIVTNEFIKTNDYEDIFSKQFKRYLELRTGKSTPSKSDANLIADALSMIYVGTTSDESEIPLTLSRETGIAQNVQLITGTISTRQMKVVARKTHDSKFNKGKERFELLLSINKMELETVLSLPMLDYFEELKNGVIATNIDPQLSHGVESLKAQISKELDDEEEDVIEMTILKNSGNKDVRLELTDNGRIREV